MRILLIEDDGDAAAFLSKGLVESGYSVDHADNGDDGLHMALTSEYDVLVVDRMLPGRDGLSIIVMLRAGGDATPALGEVDDRVAGLKAGGDDYVVKPYAFSELLARLEALLRRAHPQVEQTRLEAADLVLDLKTHHVTRAGKRIHLQPREYRLLEFFLRHQGHVVTRTMLLEQVWDYSFDPQTNVIDVHSGAPITVPGHRDLLAQAIGNLLDNAVKYTPRGGKLYLELIPGEGTVDLVVEDSGPGIPEKERHRVKQRFARLDAVRQKEGNGLGLSLVDAIARQHGATLLFEDNEPGLRAIIRFQTA